MNLHLGARQVRRILEVLGDKAAVAVQLILPMELDTLHAVLELGLARHLTAADRRTIDT